MKFYTDRVKIICFLASKQYIYIYLLARSTDLRLNITTHSLPIIFCTEHERSYRVGSDLVSDFARVTNGLSW